MIYVHWYDANSERMVRTSGEHEALYVDYSASRVLYQACLSIAMTGKQVAREREMKNEGVKRRKDHAKKIAHTIKPISHVLSIHAYAPFRFQNNKRTIMGV